MNAAAFGQQHSCEAPQCAKAEHVDNPNDSPQHSLGFQMMKFIADAMATTLRVLAQMKFMGLSTTTSRS